MKISITVTRKPRLKKPILICAWPGMGEVAFKLALHLKETLRMEEFAGIEAPELFPSTGIRVKDNLIDMPKIGSGKFYFYKSGPGLNDIMLFLSDAQPLLEHAYDYCRRILDLAKGLNVKKVFTFAAMPQAIDHSVTPEVWLATTEKRTIDELLELNIGLKPLSAGQVSGLNGLILGVAKEMGMDGVCFLGEIPLFTIQIENPKTSLVILDKLTKILKFHIDQSGLADQARFVEQEIEKLINYINVPEQQTGPIGEDEIEKIKKSLSLYTKLPQSARERIEKLFREVRQTIAKANELKKELDQWNVYKEYEDRFLDLFKKPRAGDEKKHN